MDWLAATRESGSRAMADRSSYASFVPSGGGGARPRIWGPVPARNPAFTGRETILNHLRQALERQTKRAALPHVLHGVSGIGKTQLAVEFAYRYADRYDVIWWIPAEQRSLVLQSLYALGQPFDLPDTVDLPQAASLTLERLATTPLRWLIVYDNANEPDEVVRLMPTRGGHVILTSRTQAWPEVWDRVQVDTFARDESIELVLKRSEGVSASDADHLAERLGDLPLALDQAASCQAATGLPVVAYLAEFEQHLRELSKGQPPTNRTKIAALLRLAIRRLRATAPAVAELLEMFSYLGPEPISGGLLHRGREADVSLPLALALRDQVAWDRVVRELRRYGLAAVDPDHRIQVHRLFQEVLRDEVDEAAAQRAQNNVERLLASANPGYPDDERTWPVHDEFGPHISFAGLIDSELPGARRVVLDQIRYQLRIGDLEGSRRLGEAAVEAWSKVEGVTGLGPNGALTLLAMRSLAVVLRHLGFNERSRNLSEAALDRLRESPEFGPDHEYTLSAMTEVAPNLRVAGLFREARELDEDNLRGCRRLFGENDEETLKARSNLAVNLRMLSDFAGAHEIDADVVRSWRQSVGESDNRLLFAQMNLARDLFGLGLYPETLALLQGVLPPYRQQLGPRHPNVLSAGRTLAMTLRKVGRYEEALAVAAEHHGSSESRYGPQHEQTLTAAMTHANSLRVTGDLAESHDLATRTMERCRRAFGEAHPLTLAASVNYAIVLRQGVGEWAQARELNERVHAQATEALGIEHRYTLCVANNLANDLVVGGEREAAHRLSAKTLQTSRMARGERHPDTLACAVNAALDVVAVCKSEEGRVLLDEAVMALGEVMGVSHPETLAARAGRRADCDIEPPPT